MRPIKLELLGFTAYRELTICDFRGADLFVVTGPTGSGKSSLIDAMTFALYGSVPRYGNPNLVHPVISQGKLEAKVRFDFEVEGRTYTAVRIVRRTRGGATTREARLESEGRTLAGNADEVSARVREVLGLDFTQFTTCVVLPQGEFARFLHDTPADRQDLLTKLLGVGIYEKAGNLARIREAEALQKATLHRDELERLGRLTEATEAKARTRVFRLETLRKAIESEEPAIEALRRRASELSERSKQIEREKLLLEDIPPLPDTAQLSERIAAAREELAAARRASVEAESELASAESAASRLPTASTIRELTEQAGRLRQADREAETARRSLARAEEERSSAATAEEEARLFLEETRRKLAAHDLRGHLAKGERCPVCLRAIERMPRGELPPALGDAEKSLAKAVKDKARADKAWHEASQRSALAAEKRKDLRDRMEESKDLLSQAETVAAAEARLGEARIRARRSRERDRAAGAELERLSSLERTAFRSFEEARDRVASLGPPSSNREDLRGSWTELAAWAGKERAVRIEAARAAVKAVEDLESEQEKKEAALVSRCRDLEVRVDGRPRDAIVAALAKAERDLEAIAEGLARIACLREAVKKEAEDARVAGALGQHLRSTGFERWLLEEAFERLVDGATRILKELSSGQYSFEYDERLNFEVIDHRNADERRSARTLSGGETFLASLALALTLAEQTVELAASGSARLESLFLDEGFGTLDDETLEVVASTIDELGTRGRMVGVVTHQQNLASRIPVQYRVSKNPVTSTVTKVVS